VQQFALNRLAPLRTRSEDHELDAGLKQYVLMRDLYGNLAPGSLSFCPRQPWHLIDLLHRSQAARATDPRDRIYALLNPSKDKLAVEARPDYSQTVEQTFVRFAKLSDDVCILRALSLSMKCYRSLLY
jgi:hypothetical protein